MAKTKKAPEEKAAPITYQTTAEPKAMADGIPVFCAHDAIVPTETLIPNPRNPNKHPPEQIRALAKIIRASGWRQPITVSTRSGFIVKGHGRLLSAQLDDMGEVPVDYQNYASEAEEWSDLIADNRLAELSEIDSKLLADLMADVDTGATPFELTGYTEEEYGKLVTALSEAKHSDLEDPDAVIEPPAEPVTQYGDLWIIGRHRVMCGNCTKAEDKALLLADAAPELLLTDPPYCSGGSQESKKSTGSVGTKRKDGAGGWTTPMVANDILSTRGYQNLISAALTDLPCLYAYICTDWRMWVYLFDLVEGAGFGVKSMIVWDKETPGMGVGWRSQHEIIMFAARGKTSFDGHKGYGNVLRCTRSGNEFHPTQKPTELLGMILDNNDWATGVYDPFGGSGSTLIACEDAGQSCYMMELSPAHVDVAVKRYLKATGRRDVRCIRNGQELPLEEIAGIFEIPEAPEDADEE